MLRRALIAALTSGALFATLAGPAAAHPLPHADAPRILNPRPEPGAVVAEGGTLVAALIATSQPLTHVRLLVDGDEVPLDVPAGDHPTVGAAVAVGEGWHTVELEVANAAGQDRRVWRFRGSDLGVGRLAGTGRVQTAVAISQDRFPAGGSADAAVLARADDYPDALAGGPLAAALSAPLLLTTGDRLSADTAAELDRVLSTGATVYLLGGGAALEDGVRADVEARGFRVERFSGAGRYETAAAISEQLEEPSTALVASGEGFADALSASSAAAHEGYPILLTRRDTLPDATRAYLEQAGLSQVVVVGGAGAVGDAVVTALQGIVGTQGVSRVAGADRYATSAAVAQRFFPTATSVAVTSGRAFPDALAGGPHAAGRDAPILLTGTSLPGSVAAYVQSVQPTGAVVYGGGQAVDDAVVADLRRVVASHGGPQLVGRDLPPRRVASLDEVVLAFDRELDLSASSVHVTIDGHEAGGTLGIGDFADTLVFTIRELPEIVQPGVVHRVSVVAAVTDGSTWRHVEHRFELARPRLTLSRGDRGAEVLALQQQLAAHRYWAGPADGVYGTVTHQAVMALQKVHGLTADGVYGQATRAALEAGPAVPAARSTSGLVYEVDLSRRLLLLVADGQVAWIFNASAGHGRVYEFEGSTFRANTTTGRHRVTRQIDGVREAARGRLWRPKYYDDSRGIAIHGSSSVPAHNASAGCIRVTDPAMNFLWTVDPGPGAGVWVYPEDHYSGSQAAVSAGLSS